MLWRIEYFVEGKNLEKALAGAAGIAINMTTPQPVSGATVVKQSGQKKLKGSSNSSLKEEFMAWIKQIPVGAKVSTKGMVKHYVDEMGGSRQSLGPILQTLLEEGQLKRISRGQYQCI